MFFFVFARSIQATQLEDFITATNPKIRLSDIQARIMFKQIRLPFEAIIQLKYAGLPERAENQTTDDGRKVFLPFLSCFVLIRIV